MPTYARVLFLIPAKRGEVAVYFFLGGCVTKSKLWLAALPRVRLRTELPKARHSEGFSPWQSLINPRVSFRADRGISYATIRRQCIVACRLRGDSSLTFRMTDCNLSIVSFCLFLSLQSLAPTNPTNTTPQKKSAEPKPRRVLKCLRINLIQSIQMPQD